MSLNVELLTSYVNGLLAMMVPLLKCELAMLENGRSSMIRKC